MGIIVALTLGGCEDPAKEALKAREDAIRVAKEVVAAKLRDPQSAQFTEVRTTAQPGSSGLVCGFVNAKNGFGGYVGAQRFIALPSFGSAYLDEPNTPLGSHLFEDKWRECQRDRPSTSDEFSEDLRSSREAMETDAPGMKLTPPPTR